MENVIIMKHPLITHKISRLRDKNTGTNEFRALVEEIAMLMGYEALSDLPTEEIEVETPIETCRKKACHCTDSTCRTGHGEWYYSTCTDRKDWSYRFIP